MLLIENVEFIIHATAKTTQIIFDLKTRMKTEVDDWVRQSLSSYENL